MYPTDMLISGNGIIYPLAFSLFFQNYIEVEAKQTSDFQQQHH